MGRKDQAKERPSNWRKYSAHKYHPKQFRAIRMACFSIDLSILVNQGPSARKRCRIILADARLGSSSHGDALIRKQLEQTAQSIRKTQRVLLLNKEPVFAVSTQLFY